MTDTGPVIDQYSPLDHKAGMAEPAAAFPPWAAEHARRLMAYRILAAYCRDVARLFLRPDPDEPGKADNWQEFGDAALVASRIASSVLGEEPGVMVVGADATIPDEPDIPPEPEPPGEGLSEAGARIAQRVFEEASRVWEETADQIIDRWLEDRSDLQRLLARQDALQEWAEEEALIAKIIENEHRHICPLGDGVYVLGWDAGNGRPSIEIFEPDAYYPVLDTRQRGFPAKVHLAWQYTETGSDGKDTEFVRRLTYELLSLEEAAEEGLDIGSAPSYLGPDEEWTHACFLSDGTVEAAEFEQVDAPVLSKVVWATEVDADGNEVELNRAPLGLDFMPVVHVPNSLSEIYHFGDSVLVALPQLLDEIAASDTDESMSSRWAARPPLVISGFSASGESIDITPGKAIKASEKGGLSTVELAANLREIRERGGGLRDLLAVIGQTPNGILGRIDASDVPSGVTLALSFTPFKFMIELLRLARARKYGLVPKFVQRIGIVNGYEPFLADPVVYPGGIRFGAFMPQDLAGSATVITQLRSAGVMGQQTGIRMAKEAGAPIEDVHTEFLAAREEMGETADRITSALEDPKYAAEFLRVRGYDAEVGDGVDVEGGGVTPPAGGAVPPVV